MSDYETQNKTLYDISIIRPEMRIGDFKTRGKGMHLARLRTIKKGLLTLHTLELMAITIYRFQITTKESELNRLLIAATGNEMTHYQDFQIKLLEYGWKPAKQRCAYWLVGFVIGFLSRLRGNDAILRTGIWAESKAIEHYDKLLQTIDWDKDTRRVIEKDQADEIGHITRWKKLLHPTIVEDYYGLE